jgi:hypothetical protein
MKKAETTPTPLLGCLTISEKQRDDNLLGAFFVPRGFVHNTWISNIFYGVGKMTWSKTDLKRHEPDRL